eukprot:6312417-Pyramimonas_sp.AAC.1
MLLLPRRSFNRLQRDDVAPSGYVGCYGGRRRSIINASERRRGVRTGVSSVLHCRKRLLHSSFELGLWSD